ncbi:Glycosyl transferase family 2 [Roseivivax sediminis]|uniref:Glycosyl transferase family 2 n=2 Tax=Roseivivax sediminis TaxID=936889 RepID=A0A1I1VHV7_9RHOB|nr:Glycosyl transferase family 2 [Roseivivax sediminis]
MPVLLSRMEERRAPLSFAPGEALGSLETDLAALADAVVCDPDTDPGEAPPFRSDHHRKRHALRKEFTGQSELACLNGLVIAHLRKRDWPDHAPALFQRIWTEQGADLTETLDPRWLVSSLSTFGDHGATTAQRSLGLALSTLMGAMKLYEFERLHSGTTPETPHPLDRRVAAPLPMEMAPYSLTSGGLDVNLIGRLWREAEADPVIGPPAMRLLDMLIHDPGTLFGRLQVMRQRKARKDTRPASARPAPDAARLRWGLVSLVKAPSRDVLRFAAHHLELGATELHIFLDAPEPEVVARLGDHPKIRVTVCDTAYWERAGKPRPGPHQLRQAWVATQVLHGAGAGLDWLGHIDVDEFLLPRRPVAEALSELHEDTDFARIVPAELLALEAGGPARHFKLTHKGAGQPKAVVQDIYPTFGLHLYGGFLSHVTGKVFVRTGQPGDIRFGIHALRRDGVHLKTKTQLSGVHLGHLHAPSWAHFRDHLEFRRSHGSYRKRNEDPADMGLADILAFLDETEGEDGLRAFFEEVCRDTPELRARLAAHGMLLDHPLDLDAAVARVFGTVPA